MELDAPDLANALVELVPVTEQHRDLLRTHGAVESMYQSMPAVERGAGYDAYFDHVLRSIRDGELVGFAIHETGSRNFMGVCAFVRPKRFHRRVDIGYIWLCEAYRGRGVFAAVQHALIKRALDWGCRRIGWIVEADNARAIGAIESLGATREGTLRSYARFASGEWIDLASFSLLRDEAPEVLNRLEQQIMAAMT